MTSDLNRAFWDERVPIHTASDFYDVEGFKAGREPLEDFELDDLGDVTDSRSSTSSATSGSTRCPGRAGVRA